MFQKYDKKFNKISSIMSLSVDTRPIVLVVKEVAKTTPCHARWASLRADGRVSDAGQ